MAGVILGVAFLMALAAATSRSAAAAQPAATHDGVDASVKKIVDSGDHAKMLAAANAAAASGNRQLSDSLTRKAADAAIMNPSTIMPSPFPSVSAPAWTHFVRLLMGKNPREITSEYHLGLFAFGMPRLVDLGLATNPVKQKQNGKNVWNATWTPPASLEAFLASPSFQYHAFVKAVTQDLHAIKEKLPNAVGTEIDGQPATPSGLLAVVKQAGLKNLETWIASADVRAKFPSTSAQFHKLNGIF
jgi:hypothetical protein